MFLHSNEARIWRCVIAITLAVFTVLELQLGMNVNLKINMQSGHVARAWNKGMHNGHAAWALRMYMQHVHALPTCSIGIMHTQHWQHAHGHAAWTWSMDMQHGHEAWTCSMDLNLDMKRGHAALKCSMFMQHGLSAYTVHVVRACNKGKQQRHAAWTWRITWSMNMTNGHEAWTYFIKATYYQFWRKHMRA
jgi:hypothetical protein